MNKNFFFYFFFNKIKQLIKNLIIKISYVKSLDNKNKFFHDYLKFCEKRFSKKGINYKNKNLILCDVFTIPEYILINQFAIDELTKADNSIAVSYGKYLRNKDENILYNAIGINNHICVSPNFLKSFQSLYFLFQNAKKIIKTKKQLLEFSIDGVEIGRDIYESILRTGLQTINLNDSITWNYIYMGLENYVFFNQFFIDNKVNALVLSHDMYIHMGIVSKVGYKHNIPTYLFSVHEFKKLTYQYQLDDRFKDFPTFFNNAILNLEEKNFALNWSKETLEKRLNGQIGVEMSYQVLSAFTNEQVKKQVLDNGLLNIVIATHEFYDNPHACGGLLFEDFHEWLTYIGELSKVLNYNFYLKPHRDALDDEISILKEFEKKYDNFIFLNPNYTFHQLNLEGIKHVLTCYGTVGHELPLLGMIVINAGNNPHIAYNFNFNPQNIYEYENLLRNIANLKININHDEIYEFFYVYKKILNSMKLSIYDFDFHNSENIFEIFINNSEVYEKNTLYKIRNFIESDVSYYHQINNNIK